MAQYDNADGYYRVSSPKQATLGHALERYREDLIAAGVSPDRIFYDVESGMSETREGYNTVLDRVRRGITKKVLVPCFDRFTRSPLLWEQAMEDFLGNGAVLIPLGGMAVDLSSPEGRYKSRLDAVAAAYVAEKNQASAKAGWAGVKKRGQAHNACFGYKVIAGKYEPNHDRYHDHKSGESCWEVSQWIVKQLIKSGTMRGALRLAIKKYGLERKDPRRWADFPRTQAGLRKWFHNPLLRGLHDVNGVQIQTHEPLIPPDQWLEVKGILDSKKQRKGYAIHNDHTLAGCVYCQKCKSRMISQGVTREGKRYIYYSCPLSITTRSCSNTKWLREDRAVAAAIQAICQKGQKIADLLSQSARTSDDLIQSPTTSSFSFQSSSPEIIELERKLSLLGDDPDFEDSRQKLKLKLDALLSKRLEENAESSIRQEYLVALKDPAFWEQLPKENKSRYFRVLILRVWSHKGQVTGVEVRD